MKGSWTKSMHNKEFIIDFFNFFLSRVILRPLYTDSKIPTTVFITQLSQSRQAVWRVCKWIISRWVPFLFCSPFKCKFIVEINCAAPDSSKQRTKLRQRKARITASWSFSKLARSCSCFENVKLQHSKRTSRSKSKRWRAFDI